MTDPFFEGVEKGHLTLPLYLFLVLKRLARSLIVVLPGFCGLWEFDARKVFTEEIHNKKSCKLEVYCLQEV